MKTLPLGYLIKRVQEAFRHQMDRVLAPLDLTAASYAALFHLAHTGPQSGASLARAAWVTPQTMHRITLTLQTRGFIKAKANQGRSILLELTEEGRRTFTTARLAVEKVEKQLIAQLSSAEQEALRYMLERCFEALTSEPGSQALGGQKPLPLSQKKTNA